MAMMNKGKHISWIAGAALAAALLPYSAAYAQLSCSAAIEPDIGAGAPSPIRLGDTVPIVVNIGVNGISSGDFMNVTQVEYALDCQNAEDDPGNCIDDGEAIAFNNNVTTDCTDADGFPITWTPSLSPGDTNPNVMFFNADNPVKILENDSCNLFFDVQVLQLGTDADPEIISSAAAFSGICDNNFGGNAEASLGIEVVPDPSIDIEKHTNGQDADNPTGPIIPVGDAVLWEYFVSNTGDVDLSNVTVTDDQGVAVSCPQTDLAVGESMTCTGNGTAAAGQYANIGTATGTPPVGPPVDDTDPSHYFGADPAISIEKHTNGQDADNPTGPIIPVGDAVLWEYFVTNTGNVPLVGVTVTDDQGVAVSCPQTDLAVGESMTCTGNGTAAAGQYANIGTATGTPPVGPPVDDTDPSHYFGAEADLTFSKACESRDDAENPDQPSVAGDQLAKWSLTLTSTGNRALTCTITDPGTTLDGVVVELAANGDSATQTGTSTKLASELADIDGVTNKASVTCTGEGIADITDEASATCPLLVPPQATLTVSKTATKETKWTWGIEKSADQNTVEEPVLILEEGTPRTVEYTVTVNADDSYTISGVITIGTDDQAVTVDVEDTMSDGTIVDLSCDNGTQNPQATNIVEGVQINANGQAECTYEVTLDDAPPADLINTATVTVTDPAQDPQDPPIIFESNPTPVVQGDVIDECINVDDIHGDNVPQMIDQEVCAPDDLTDGEKSFMYTLTFGDESTQPDVVLACDEFITHPNTATFETVEVDGTGAPHQQGESMWTVDAQLNCLPPPSDICEAGKPLTLIVSYDADYDTNHSQVSNEVIIDPTSGDPLPNTVYIVAQDGTNKNNKNSVLAEGTVSVNGTLEVFGAEKKNGGNHRVPPRTIFFIYDEEGGNLLQTVQFHTSCSQPLFTGDEFGAITVHSATH